MTDVTDLTLYKNKAYLELCLDLIEDVRISMQSGCYDLAESQLNDIVETFDRQQLADGNVSYNAGIYSFKAKGKCQ